MKISRWRQTCTSAAYVRI